MKATAIARAVEVLQTPFSSAVGVANSLPKDFIPGDRLIRERQCAGCGESFAWNGTYYSIHCPPCVSLRTFMQWRAIIAVRKARRRGVLPDPHTQICKDCGQPAKHYDHRDYRIPLAVAAVCHGCNIRRGRALFFGPVPAQPQSQEAAA